ncbi:TonB-dependent receptor [Terriglobus aquaticus]|uniref:TonB-dependent receptor n=1 Tax=Terriglobus aquaticus TaxID=940139 RepID=A0ABW9KF11_9BACT|nr:carboxypeptidase-like regulatory domain-containing protein [Terriglobus aquaticus]
MRHKALLAATPLAAAVLIVANTRAQDCSRAQIEVLDSTGAAIVGASVVVDNKSAGITDAHGHFATACLTSAAHTARVAAENFETVTAKLDPARTLTLRLKPSTAETIDAVDEDPVSNTSVAGTKELKGDEIKQLADDPDEFGRQLQVLAAAAGGAPGQAIIAVDGFQNGGRIPPKSAIAFIRVNPDLFSAEYERPPYQGGRVEIYTKPGQGKLHGALFTTQSGQFLNAADPFAPSKAAIGRQRYGFELGGPIKTNRADFFVALEHRQIDQFAVVNAVTLDANAQPQQVTANVATPQSLWEASARFGLLLGPHNNFTGTYTATVNGLTNQGVGGTTLQQAGYNSAQSEHSIRLTNLQTVSANLLHESRLGLTWRLRDDTPLSSAPQLSVAGAFTGGGATTQALRSHELDTEFDDDILLQRKKHSIKAGLQLLNIRLNDDLPTNHNGTFIFGGGTAPVLNANNTATSQTTVITGLEQYRRALLNLPGGTPTQFAITTGAIPLGLNQLRVVLFAQDQWKLRPRLELSGGLRWSMQTAPTTLGNIAPRIGVAWAPDRKQRWVLHARTGLFFSAIDNQTTLEANRLNGINQTQLQITNPQYTAPLTTGTARVTTLRAPLPQLSQVPSIQTHFGIEHDFPQHWHAQVNLYLARAWNDLRSRNINAPLPTASTQANPNNTRPGAPDLNLYQYQQTGNLGGNVLFAGVDQHSFKRLQIFAGYIRMNLRTNADTNALFPQSSYSEAGEYARPTWQNTHHVIAFTNYVFPLGFVLSNQFDAASGTPFNITTGFDNNGDGIFNDRPYFASQSDASAIATPFGTLTSNTASTAASITRNAGTLPWNIHLDANLSREFKLPHHANSEARSLTANIRSANLLNHTNVTAVGGVLGSPLFNRAYAADPGRRIEAGLRFAF